MVDEAVELPEVWPEQLERMANTIGKEAALKLADRFGGVQFYIPSGEVGGHAWEDALTPEQWAAVRAVFGGSRLTLPRGVFRKLKKVVILELGGQGLTVRQIALRVRASARYVQTTLAGAGVATTKRQHDERQHVLPFHKEG